MSSKTINVSRHWRFVLNFSYCFHSSVLWIYSDFPLFLHRLDIPCWILDIRLLASCIYSFETLFNPASAGRHREKVFRFNGSTVLRFDCNTVKLSCRNTVLSCLLPTFSLAAVSVPRPRACGLLPPDRNGSRLTSTA